MIATSFLVFFFFFKEKDAIGFVAVTGFQSCPLPTPPAKAAPAQPPPADPPAAAQPSATLRPPREVPSTVRSEEHTSELQSRLHLVCRLLLEKKKKNQ